MFRNSTEVSVEQKDERAGGEEKQEAGKKTVEVECKGLKLLPKRQSGSV